MLGIYRQWTDEEHDLFLTREWLKFENEWWGYFLCSSFKEQWSYEDLVKSLDADLEEDKSIDEIREKYLEHLL